MYSRRSAFLIGVVLAGLSSVFPARARAQNDLVGAWEVVSRTYLRGDSTWTEPYVHPDLYLFTESHYSVQEIRETGPRADFSAGTSDAERLTAFDAFHAHGGTYEVRGDRLVVQISIAKGPNTMSAGRGEYRIEWDGGELLVIRDAPAEREIRTTRLRRIE